MSDCSSPSRLASYRLFSLQVTFFMVLQFESRISSRAILRHYADYKSNKNTGNIFHDEEEAHLP